MKPTGSRPIHQLSRGRGPAVHRYYDVELEEPGGERLLYFEFDGESIPGPGCVVVCDADGQEARQVGFAEHAIGHIGAGQAWLGRGVVGFCPSKSPPTLTRIIDLADGSRRQIDLEVRSFHNETGLAIAQRAGAQNADDARDPRRQLLVCDLHSGAERTVLTTQIILSEHPLRDRCRRDLVRFQNPKWSPDGSQLFAVFTDEGHEATATGTRWRPAKVKSLIVVDADGHNPRYLGEFGHHPMWAPSGRYLIAHNRRADGEGQDLVAFDLDGGGPRPLIERFTGIHSTLDRAEHRVISDAFDYPETGDGSVLLYDLATGGCEVLARGPHHKRHHFDGSHIHPAWSRDEKRIFFNHAATGSPQLYAINLA